MIPIFYHDIVTPSGHRGRGHIRPPEIYSPGGRSWRCGLPMALPDREELTATCGRRLLVISAEDVGLGEPMAPVVVDALSLKRPGALPGTAPIINCSSSTRCAICAPAGRSGPSVLASVVKRRIRRGETPFPCLIMCMTCTR